MTDAYVDSLVHRDGRGRLHHGPGSNFFECEDGWILEVWYQIAKHSIKPHPWRVKILKNCTPGRAKKLARQWRLPQDELLKWEETKREVMRQLLRQKLEHSPEFKEWLTGTRNLLIVEGNDWHDNEWGNCRCGEPRCRKPGQNWLGRLLMDVRAELQVDQPLQSLPATAEGPSLSSRLG